MSQDPTPKLETWPLWAIKSVGRTWRIEREIEREMAGKFNAEKRVAAGPIRNGPEAFSL